MSLKGCDSLTPRLLVAMLADNNNNDADVLNFEFLAKFKNATTGGGLMPDRENLDLLY